MKKRYAPENGPEEKMENAFLIRDGVLIEYNGPDEDVQVPRGVTEIGERAFFNCGTLRRAALPESVTRIGRYAFDSCYSMREVVLPGGVTEIGENAFRGCTGLVSITFPGSVRKIGNGAFSGCKTLKKLELPGSVTEIGDDVFSDCAGLTSAVLPECLVRVGKNAFRNCVCLAGITLPQGLLSIGKEAFYGCAGIAEIAIPDGVGRIDDHAFAMCAALKKITFGKNVREIGNGAFSDCAELEEMEFPGLLAAIGDGAFYNCLSVGKVYLPDSVVSIGNYAFSGCRKLAEAVLPGHEVRIGRNIFKDCAALRSVTLPEGFSGDMAELPDIVPEEIHAQSIGLLKPKARPAALIGFVREEADPDTQRAREHREYMTLHADKLVSLAMQNRELLVYMVRHALIPARHAGLYLECAVNGEDLAVKAMMLDYCASDASGQKQEAKRRQEEERLNDFLFDVEHPENAAGKIFFVTGRLRTFSGRKELAACLDMIGGKLSKSLTNKVDYLISNVPAYASEQNRRARELGVRLLTEDEFNRMIGR